jgi:hypothetical protein
MMNRKMILGIIAFAAVIVFTVSGTAACSKSGGGGGKNDITGTWVGVVKGNYATVEITKTRWSISIPGANHTDAGTYTKDDDTYIMQSTVSNTEVGTGSVIDKNTFSFTFYQKTIAPGTYTLKKQYVEGDFKVIIADDGKSTTITEYTGSGGDVRIPQKIQRLPVTGITQSAFYDCTSLTSVIIPDSVTIIGDGIFNGCTGLTSITIPGNVTIIDAAAFGGCTGLTSITIPDSGNIALNNSCG